MLQIINGQGGWPLNARWGAAGWATVFMPATYFPPHQWLDVLQQLQNVFVNDPIAYWKLPNPLPMVSMFYRSNPRNWGKTLANKPITTLSISISKIDFEWGRPQKSTQIYVAYRGLSFCCNTITWQKNSQGVRSRSDIAQRHGSWRTEWSNWRWICSIFNRRTLVGTSFRKKMLRQRTTHGVCTQSISANSKFFYKAVVEKTIAFAERELHNNNGGFYASIDADSEHEEGKFMFHKQEIESVPE